MNRERSPESCSIVPPTICNQRVGGKSALRSGPPKLPEQMAQVYSARRISGRQQAYCRRLAICVDACSQHLLAVLFSRGLVGELVGLELNLGTYGERL